MASLIQSVVILALVLMGLAVMVGAIEPREALKKILIFLAIVVFAPAFAAVLVGTLIVPALELIRAAVKPILIVAVALAVFALVLWIVLRILPHR